MHGWAQAATQQIPARAASQERARGRAQVPARSCRRDMLGAALGPKLAPPPPPRPLSLPRLRRPRPHVLSKAPPVAAAVAAMPRAHLVPRFTESRTMMPGSTATDLFPFEAEEGLQRAGGAQLSGDASGAHAVALQLRALLEPQNEWQRVVSAREGCGVAARVAARLEHMPVGACAVPRGPAGAWECRGRVAGCTRSHLPDGRPSSSAPPCRREPPPAACFRSGLPASPAAHTLTPPPLPPPPLPPAAQAQRGHGSRVGGGRRAGRGDAGCRAQAHWIQRRRERGARPGQPPAFQDPAPPVPRRRHAG